MGSGPYTSPKVCGPVTCTQPKPGVLLHISWLVVTLYGCILSIRNENNPFLSPNPSLWLFFPARPDLPIVLSPTPPQSSPVRLDPGPSCLLPLHSTPPSNPSSRSDYQPNQGTSSNSLKFITQLICSHIFLSFACGQLRVTRSHFISKELCPVISCPK